MQFCTRARISSWDSHKADDKTNRIVPAQQIEKYTKEIEKYTEMSWALAVPFTVKPKQVEGRLNLFLRKCRGGERLEQVEPPWPDPLHESAVGFVQWFVNRRLHQFGRKGDIGNIKQRFSEIQKQQLKFKGTHARPEDFFEVNINTRIQVAYD